MLTTSVHLIRRVVARKPPWECALARATLKASDIGYLNLHGTATKLNDAMEAIAVSRVFGSDAPCSSTKPMTGHLLGAAGACEAALSIMALHANRLPLHLWDGERDRALPKISLVEDSDQRWTLAAS